MARPTPQCRPPRLASKARQRQCRPGRGAGPTSSRIHPLSARAAPWPAPPTLPSPPSRAGAPLPPTTRLPPTDKDKRRVFASTLEGRRGSHQYQPLAPNPHTNTQAPGCGRYPTIMATPIAPRSVTGGGGSDSLTIARAGRHGRRRSAQRRGPGMSRVFVLCLSCGADNHIRRAYCRRCFRAKDTPSGPRSATGTAAVAAAAELRVGGAGGSCRHAATTTADPSLLPSGGADEPRLLAASAWEQLAALAWFPPPAAATVSCVTDVTWSASATTGRADRQCLEALHSSELSAVTSETMCLERPSRAERCEDDTTWVTRPVHPSRPRLSKPMHDGWKPVPEQRPLVAGRSAPASTSRVSPGEDDGTMATCSSTSREWGRHNNSGGTPPAAAVPAPEDLGDLIDRILS